MFDYTALRRNFHCLLFNSNPGVLGWFWLSIVVFFSILPFDQDVSFAAYVMGTLGFISWGTVKCSNFKIKTFFIPFALYAGVALIACLLNPETIRSFPRVLLWSVCLYSGYTLSRLIPDHNYKFILPMVLIILFSFIVILPILHVVDNHAAMYRDYRLDLFTNHPARLALLSAVGFLYCLDQGMRKKKFISPIWPACLVLLIVLFLTNARVWIIFLPLVLVFYFFLFYRQYIVKFALAITIILMFTTALIFYNQGSAAQRLISIFSAPSEDTAFLTRMPIWEVGWWAFRESPLTGNGIKSYRNLHIQYEEQNRQSWEERYAFYEISVKNPHNIILGRLVETGLLGTLPFFIFYIMALRHALRSQNQWLAIFLLYYLLIGLTEDPLYRINDSFVLFIIGTVFGRSLSPEVDSLNKPIHS